MNRAIFALAFALFILPTLLIGRSEIIIGENFVAYDAIIYFNVSKFIVVDFGPGWKQLYASERIRPGEVKHVNINFDPEKTYVYVTGNTNVPTELAFGIPSNQPFFEELIIDGYHIPRGEYRDMMVIPPGYGYVPSQITALFNVTGLGVGTHQAQFIICVYDSAYSPYDVCPPL
ncbi:MAG: hypothetical protein QXW35_02695 [Candidatus Aenigmatarchaeota archaeon]